MEQEIRSMLEGLVFPQKRLAKYWITPRTAVLHIDTGLMLKEKGFDSVIAIKNDGIVFGRLFEKVGFDYFEIDYSCHSRKTCYVTMENEQFLRLKGKKPILVDVDICNGETLNKTKKYLEEKEIIVNAAYLGFWSSPCFRIDSSGFRKLDKGMLFNWQITPLKGLEIYTNTAKDYINAAEERVSKYFEEIANTNI